MYQNYAVYIVERIREKDERITELEEALRSVLGCLERADTSEGYCMCGSDMSHSPWEGHTPVDAGNYCAARAMEAAKLVLGKHSVTGSATTP